MREKLIKWRPHGALGRRSCRNSETCINNPFLLAHLAPFLLGPASDITLAAALEPLSSAPCNVHLIVLILDRILMGLFPELGAGVDIL
jgi:hypothetical protein